MKGGGKRKQSAETVDQGIKHRLDWARSQMEQAYAEELGVAPEPAKHQRPTQRKAGKGASGEKVSGEQAAAEANCNMTAVMSEYEVERQQRMEANRKNMPVQMMQSMGLSAEGVAACSSGTGRARAQHVKRVAAPLPPELLRRSSRSSASVARYGEFAAEGWHMGSGSAKPRSQSCSHGQPEGVAVGQLWLSRVDCSQAGVHGPWVGGIHGGEGHGAYSIVLSGGYEGDTDAGEEFTYTGSGGRDLSGNKRTAPQSSDQQLAGPNKALAVNIWRKQPMRVVRGYKLKSDYAPAQGYRFDGLYNVVEMWPDVGQSGFVIWRFRMRRAADQEAPPWKGKKWREMEAKQVAAAKDAKEGAYLIPLGTGTIKAA